MNDTLEEMARALFKDWFVDFGPVHAKMEGREPYLPTEVWALFPNRLVDSELGPIPAGWDVCSFGDIVKQLRSNVNPQLSPNTLYNHFSIPAFDQGKIPMREYGYDIKSTKSQLEPGVVLVSKLNPEIERVWLVDVQPDEKAICSTEFLVLLPTPPFQRSYVYCLTQSPPFRSQIQSLVTGTSGSHQRARAETVLSLQSILPPSPIIHAFDYQSSVLLDRSLALHKGTNALATLRNTLLPKLVSGEIRVGDIKAVPVAPL